MPKYFGFEGVAILLKDIKTNELFTLEYDDLNPNEIKLDVYVKEQRKKSIPLTTEERIRDFERQLRPATKHIYPNSMGITGEVYK